MNWSITNGYCFMPHGSGLMVQGGRPGPQGPGTRRAPHQPMSHEPWAFSHGTWTIDYEKSTNWLSKQLIVNYLRWLIKKQVNYQLLINKYINMCRAPGLDATRQGHPPLPATTSAPPEKKFYILFGVSAVRKDETHKLLPTIYYLLPITYYLVPTTYYLAANNYSINILINPLIMNGSETVNKMNWEGWGG